MLHFLNRIEGEKKKHCSKNIYLVSANYMQGKHYISHWCFGNWSHKATRSRGMKSGPALRLILAENRV